VFPFENVGGDVDDAYFAEGLAEELIHALGATRGLRVLARNTAFALHDSAAAAVGSSSASSVKVDVLLRGSVRRRGERLRVVAHLVDARTGVEMWSERYDRNFTDIFDIQDEITRAIVNSLRAELLSDDAMRPAVPNVAAYESYLEARFFWNRRSVTGMRQSVRLLKEALKLDGEYAPAYAALAETHITLAIYGANAPADAMRDARAAAERALAVSPDLGEAVSALACVRALWDWDWTGAAAEFRRAVRLSPQSPTVAQWYAMHALVPQRDFPLAFRQLVRAQELDPLSSSAAGSIGLAHFYARNYGAAAETLRALIARDPEFAAAHGFLGQVCAERGEHRASIEHLRRSLELAPASPEFIAALGVAHARAGDAMSAREMLERLATLSKERFVSPVAIAQIHAALGEADDALSALDDAIAVRATDLAWIAVRPAFDALHGDARFDSVLRTLHLA
jgi:TolB-like protein/Flp pilus assembly protein TadD